MSNTPSLSEAVAAAVKSGVSDVRVMIPGIVTAYDEVKQSCSFQPALKSEHETEDGERVIEALPIIHGVPWQFPGSGAYRMTWPVKVGDLATLIFSSGSLDVWLQRGGVVDPGDTRQGHLSDAVAVPGLFSFNDVPTDAPGDALVLHSSDTIKLGSSSANDPIMRKSDFQAWLTAVYSLHVHPGIGVAPASIVYTLTASPKVKVE